VSDTPLLSLCVPTHNRLPYLRELLPQLLREIGEADATGKRIEFLVLENAATDGTTEYLRALNGSGLTHIRHPSDIGGDRNFLACIERARGTYIWLFGDDDLVEPGAVARLIGLLDRERPVLAILPDAAQSLSPVKSVVYSDYAACLRATSASFALSHTLISANVFQRQAFDLAQAYAMLPTNYSHMHGLLGGLQRGGTVALIGGVLRVRPVRAPFARQPMALCVKQAAYVWRLARDFDVRRFRLTAIRLLLNLPLEFLFVCTLPLRTAVAPDQMASPPPAGK
jgi:glycosyltransferase involved in cell wall biosynthesis